MPKAYHFLYEKDYMMIWKNAIILLNETKNLRKGEKTEKAFFLYLGFLSQTVFFHDYRAERKWGVYLFNSSLSFPPT